MSSPSQWDVPPWNTTLWNQGPGAAAVGRQGGPPSFTPVLTGQVILLTNAPNQSLRVSLPTANGSLTLNLQVSWNEIGLFWVLSLFDQNYQPLFSDVPLLTGYWPGANILAQYNYANCGNWYVVNCGGSSDYPGLNGWGPGGFLLLADLSNVTAPLVSSVLDV